MQPDEYIKKSLAGALKGDKNTRKTDSEAILPQNEGRMRPEDTWGQSKNTANPVDCVAVL